MAKDVGDAIGAAIGHAAREVVDTVSTNARRGSKKTQLPQLSGGKGVAAGAGLVALVPLAAKGAGMVVHGLRNGARPLQAAGDKVSGTVEDAVGKKVDEAGGASGLAKEAGKAMLPFGGGKKSGGGGVGQGRRMPIQQAVDVSAPIEDVYEQWTQYEEWPKFMHRLDRVSQDEEDDTTISFKTKIWGISREFKAEIIDERSQERIKWRVTEGVSHTGVVTFHELGPRLTRVDVDIDVHPGSMIEKLGRGLRHAKRAVRADLHRFKAHVEIEDEQEQEDSGQQEASGQQEEQTSGQQEEQTSRPSRGSKGRRAASSSSRSSSGRSSAGSSRSGASGGRSSSASRSNASRSSGGSNGASASGSSSSPRGRSRSSSSNGSGSSGSGGSRSSSGSSRRRTTSRSS